MSPEKRYHLFDGNDIIGCFSVSDTLKVDLIDNLTHYNIPIDFWNHYDQGERHFEGKIVEQFVADRVVPSGRQNIREILGKVGIPDYDPLAIFLYSHGRFASDTFHIEPI